MSKKHPRINLRKKLITNTEVKGTGDMSFYSKYPKRCWWCPHFRYNQQEFDYSEDTPGSNFSIACAKNHWSFDAFDTNLEQFRKIIETAETCKDFKPVDEIIDDRNRA